MFIEVTVEAAYLAEYFFWLQSVADAETETPPVASFSTLTTTEKFSDDSSFSTNTVTISGGDGGEDFDVDFSGSFDGGSSQRTIVEELEVKADDSVIVSDKTEILSNSHRNSWTMEIDVTGRFGGGNSDFSGTFDRHMTMATDSDASTDLRVPLIAFAEQGYQLLLRLRALARPASFHRMQPARARNAERTPRPLSPASGP